MKQSYWSPEEIEKLKNLAGKDSYAVIGKKIGRSKNSVKNKIHSMALPRLAVTPIKAKPVVVVPEKPPMMAMYKNHEVAAKKLVIRSETVSKIEWCPECHSPVSNWAEHFERLGHKRA